MPDRSGCTRCPDLLSRIAELENALEPFAREARRRPWVRSQMRSGIAGSDITNADLVAALDVLEVRNG